MKKSEVTSEEHLEGELPKMIQGAKQAVAYFDSMLKANEAIKEVIQSQLDYANSQLKSLQDEFDTKYQSAD